MPRREKNYNENDVKKLARINKRKAAEILANGFINEEALEGAELDPKVVPMGLLAGGSPGRDPVVEGINPELGAADPAPSN